MTKRFAFALMGVIVGWVLLAPITMAQEAAPTEGSISLYLVIQGGGVIGWLIILCSVVMLALAIEAFVNVTPQKLMPPELVTELETLFEDQEYQEAMELCESEQTFLTNVVGAALPKISLGYEAMAKAVSDVADEESVKLHQKVSYLSLLGNISPMLGLFGTVLGMIAAFQVIANAAGPPEPKALAGQIQVALITTFLGLLVAIPAMCFFFFFRNRVVRITLEVTGIADELIEKFRSGS